MINVHATGVQIMFYLKSYIEGHRIHLLGSLADMANMDSIGLAVAGGFFALQSRISNKIYSEPVKHVH